MSGIEQYGQAVANWISRGRPKRSDDEVRELFAICTACTPHFRPNNESVGSCGLCGCRLSIGGSAMTNKLRMATESCPDGKW